MPPGRLKAAIHAELAPPRRPPTARVAPPPRHASCGDDTAPSSVVASSGRVYTPLVTLTRCLRPLGLLLLLSILPSSPIGARSAEKKHPPQEQEDKPRVSLIVHPNVGFTPVTVVLTGHLSGVDPGARNFCHPAVTWIRRDPGRTENDASMVREDPACLHDPQEVHVPTSFSKTVDLYRPGAYLFRLIVEGKDGAMVQSAYVTVEVLRVQ